MKGNQIDPSLDFVVVDAVVVVYFVVVVVVVYNFVVGVVVVYFVVVSDECCFQTSCSLQHWRNTLSKLMKKNNFVVVVVVVVVDEWNACPMNNYYDDLKFLAFLRMAVHPYYLRRLAFVCFYF